MAHCAIARNGETMGLRFITRSARVGSDGSSNVKKTRVLGMRELTQVVEMVGVDRLLDALFERLHSRLAEHDTDVTTTIDRAGFHYAKPDLGLIEWMPTMQVGSRVAIKTVGYHPSNPTQRGLPSVLATTSLYDTVDGRLVALVESTFLTALRTGTASAIATDILAKPGPITLGIIGCGAQAVTQLHAISRIRDIERAIVFDTSCEVAASFTSRVAFLKVPIEVVGPDAIGRLVGTVDVLSTCTSVAPDAGPVVPHVKTQPWLHINAVGADFAGKIELPIALLRTSLVCPDVLSQCLLEGEAQQLEAADLGPELPELVRRRTHFEEFRSASTVFDSTGWALEDLVSAELLLELAEQHGIGIEIALQATSQDAHDPYAFLLNDNA
jgi:L-lysine cyclodeaminase